MVITQETLSGYTNVDGLVDSSLRQKYDDKVRFTWKSKVGTRKVMYRDDNTGQ